MVSRKSKKKKNYLGKKDMELGKKLDIFEWEWG